MSAELIICRECCGEENCVGCNVYTLYQMLEAGELDDVLRNKGKSNRSRKVNGGDWEVYEAAQKVTDNSIGERYLLQLEPTTFKCVHCGALSTVPHFYCFNCGTEMRGVKYVNQ